VIDRFHNPWLDHEWRVIAANQTAKLRLRVVPSLTGFARKRGIAPQGWPWALRPICNGPAHIPPATPIYR